MKRDLGAARNGTEAWLWQRISALVAVVFVPWAVWIVAEVRAGAWDQQKLLAVLDQPFARILHTLFAVFVALHTYLGLRAIAEDYLHRPVVRLGAEIALALATSAGLVWWLALIWAWMG